MNVVPFSDYLVHIVDRPCPTFTGPLSTDIVGYGLGGYPAQNNLEGCKELCCLTTGCVAIQYSADCALGCNVKCILHQRQVVVGNLFADFFVYKLDPQPGCCFGSPIQTDIPGVGIAQADVSNLQECQELCCATRGCAAIQFSPTCFFGCDIECILHTFTQTIQTLSGLFAQVVQECP
eukprot:TRINITY_DN1851_c0_g1_i1.p1 TRINITY_DN1851_c0_g1~~TRINITY_DN1851_c0_g1_i1.p1  ORF type:complete len:178 (-),score=22.60 TRINITY_DN1851_c0_g1_i1:161-694(-)